VKRKSPIKHKVSSHIRNGKRVKSYNRGSGAKITRKLSKPTLGKPKGYTVKLRYSKKPRDLETVKVIATSYKRAIDEAFEEKIDKRLPIEIVVIDPSIGEIIHWAGSRALKYGKVVAKKTGHMAKEKLKSEYSDYKIRQLIDQAYSPNRAIKTLARYKLQTQHPKVWDVMDISPT